MNRLISVVVALLLVSAAWSQRVLTTPDFTAFSGGPYSSASIYQVVPVQDGGHIVVGKFEVWYEGKLFRDVLRLKADGRPDTQWQVLANNEVSGALVLSDGVLLHGRFDYINGEAAPSPVYLSFDAARRLRFDALPAAIRTTPGSYDAASNWVYTLSSTTALVSVISRVNSRTGVLDPTWSFRLPLAEHGGSPGAPLIDQAGGLWVTWVSDQCFNSCMTTKMARFSVSEPGRELVRSLPTLWQRAPMLHEAFAYVDANRYRISDGTVDANWKTSHWIFAIDRGYAYVWTLTSTTTEVYYALRRAPLSGNGTFDDWTLELPDSKFIAGTSVRPATLAPVVGGAEIGTFVFVRSVNSPGSRVAVAVKGETQAPVAVVEYYVPAIQHYFITGRKNEQAALDALPNAFTRTGMHFTAKSSRYRDIAEQPVCRLYASPEQGLSNSHFYGIGDDCTTLNQRTGLKYEGYDFSVLRPTSSGCSAEAPNAVSRLFNNKAASNDGNHRYVVSAATKARMLARGWVDEGVVFCSASATDALN